MFQSEKRSETVELFYAFLWAFRQRYGWWWLLAWHPAWVECHMVPNHVVVILYPCLSHMIKIVSQRTLKHSIATALSNFCEDFSGRRHRLAWVVTLSKIADYRCCDQLLSFLWKRDNCIFIVYHSWGFRGCTATSLERTSQDGWDS